MQYKENIGKWFHLAFILSLAGSYIHYFNKYLLSTKLDVDVQGYVTLTTHFKFSLRNLNPENSIMLTPLQFYNSWSWFLERSWEQEYEWIPMKLRYQIT